MTDHRLNPEPELWGAINSVLCYPSIILCWANKLETYPRPLIVSLNTEPQQQHKHSCCVNGGWFLLLLYYYYGKYPYTVVIQLITIEHCKSLPDD